MNGIHIIRATASATALACALVGNAFFTQGASAEPSTFFSDIGDREKLTGDWGGARTKLEDAGVTLEATFTGDFSANASGGIRRGKGFSGLLQLGAGFDLEKLVGWQGGSIHVGAYFIRGHGLTTHELGNLLTISNIEFPHSNLLAEAYFEQKLFDDKLTFKIGQLAADGDFAVSETAGLFVNSTFGWPGLMGTDLPSGGPAYPVPTPGVFASYEFNENFTIQGGVYNGDPAGRDNVNKHNLDFPVNDGTFAIGEAQFKYAAPLPGVIKVGAWYNSLHFADLRVDVAGNPIAKRKGSYALYGVIDQTIWQAPGDLKSPEPTGAALSVFARAVVAPQSNRNLIDYYFDVGFNAKGFVPNRPDDIFGVAFGYAHISHDLPEPTGSSEMVVETSYQAKVAGWLKVQPFFQYVIRPGGGAPDPTKVSGRIKNATIFGVRTVVDF